MKAQRIIGIDFGLRRIGLAHSDATQSLAFPYITVFAGATPEQSAVNVWNTLQKEMEKKNFDILLMVVGLPKTLKGEIKERAQQVEIFANALKEISSKQVLSIDERLTTIQADRSLKELSLSRKARSKHIDEVSAALLLQSYLDLHKL